MHILIASLFIGFLFISFLFARDLLNYSSRSKTEVAPSINLSTDLPVDSRIGPSSTNQSTKWSNLPNNDETKPTCLTDEDELWINYPKAILIAHLIVDKDDCLFPKIKFHQNHFISISDATTTYPIYPTNRKSYKSNQFALKTVRSLYNELSAPKYAKETFHQT